METLSPIMIAALGAGAGAIAGSFIATAALRWSEGRSVARGRSACDGCGRRLRAHELVPLASWLVQRGRCRSCGARIDPVHPASELIAAVIGGVALSLSPDAAGVAGAGFGWALLLLALTDLKAFWLPDRVVLPLAIGGLLAAWAGPPGLVERLIGAGVGYAVLEALRRMYARARGRAGLGGGDPKLMGAIGAWLGWAALPPVLLGASLVGLAAAGVMRLRGRVIGATTRLPFGALLAPAAFLAWVFARL